jgi:dihydrofolate synthase/folylpolyglutamate synthase
VVPESYVVDFIDRHKPYLEDHALSFFEMTVGMAFAYFSEEAVDIAIIEVGLGGRLDSTNIITPEVSLITNIGMDHMEFLGETLAEIAREKAGIIKKNIPVVISETQTGVENVFREVSLEKGAPLHFADQQDLPDYPISLLGNYQKKNIRGVLAALAELKGFHVPESDIRNGLLNVIENTGLLGRWQILGEHPQIICDTAHNRAGLEIVLQQLLQEPFEELHIVLGFVRDKRLDQLLPLFPEDARYYFSRPEIPRGLDAGTLRDIAGKYGLKGDRYHSVLSALNSAKKQATSKDLIFVGGSTFTVAEVL